VTYAAALSEHPITAHAVGEVIGAVMEQRGGQTEPELALVFVSPPHAGALEDAAAAVRDVLRPRTLLGCAAGTVVGGDREVEDEPAVSLWVGDTGRVEPFHLTTVSTPDGDALVGWPEAVPEGASALLLLADPFSFPVEPFLERLSHDRPGLPVVGGLASAARGPGGNRLVVDDRYVSGGAVGCFLGPDVVVTPVVSQGCRPVGDPFTVTRSERNVVYELAGKPALERLQELAGGMAPEDRELLRRGLHLGRVVDEHKVEFDRGDFIVRNVLGGDQRTGAIAVGDLVDVGATTQFLVRDADSADEDLRHLMAGRHADGALVFTCNGRGTHLFGVPDHDAGIVSAALPGAAVAGMSCAGELGPVGGRNFLHGFTASVVLLGGR
jgi:small ligand-binding sensory domain FIST